MVVRRRRLAGWLVVAVGAAILVPVAGAGVAHAELTAAETRLGTLTLAPGATGSLTVNCQSWGQTISGGFSTAVANDVLIIASRPSLNSNGWFVSARNTLSTTQTVTVSANCAAITGRTFVSRTVSVPPNGAPDVTRACPAGTFNTGGGFVTDPVARFPVVSSRPASPGQGWTVTAFNATTAARSVTVYTMCAVFAGRQVVSQGALLEPGTSLRRDATCPTLKIVVGGGWAHGGGTGWLVNRSEFGSIFVWTNNFVNTTASVRFGVVTYAVCASVPM
jgi:hypothetical protein